MYCTDITEDKVKELGPGNIKQVSFGPPCKDHSKLRLIPRKRGKPNKKQCDGSEEIDAPCSRPGFKGKHGRVFLQVLLVVTIILQFNPECEVFGENVVFDDMAEDWSTVCKLLGTPFIITADTCSFTRRRRAYWTNIPLPVDFGQG